MEREVLFKTNLKIYNLADTTQESPIWKNYYEEELKNIQVTPPLNAFEELITLTDQGKIWQFPIDNEQGKQTNRINCIFETSIHRLRISAK